ncbi:LysR substrate-binding domain-containing protein [Chelatococcus composti]|uniref:DNA-binding transcriptional LysR family regulator n=1 Tax=Chelatococcus composti TaxID=1743235 RepID=A0A841K909_9HYPH|nr:LysR substrate-binding domain-containing protein [Chelatococcus composti]MBB6168785.1 DNA-binding transcriptional LysR family regulator [Chelatococcus composti]MBS7737392.1 LysR family transcriptional regulator [Chelatococcus composti]PZN43470.1 MAG: LysR family transcriptional regulator [Pseudomonadota bacterium]GGG42845.1 LysR family transcriptional regulator [Chelatococcus composti]
MDTRFLESLVAVADHGSMAEAARRLAITPAAVAQRIRALEAELGTTLLVRAGRTMRPTEAGAAVIERARLLLADERELKALALADTPAGELRIGAIATAVTGILPGVLARLAANYPQVEIYVQPGNSIELYDRVIGGELDAALVVEPPFAPPKTLAFALIREEPFVLAAPRAWADRDPLRLLAGEPFIRYDRNHWGGRLVDGALRRLGIRPRERFELDALDAIAVLVDRGLGVALLPDWPPPWPEGLAIARLPVPGLDISRRIGVIWPRSSRRRRLIEALIGEARRR